MVWGMLRFCCCLFWCWGSITIIFDSLILGSFQGVLSAHPFFLSAGSTVSGHAIVHSAVLLDKVYSTWAIRTHCCKILPKCFRIQNLKITSLTSSYQNFQNDVFLCSKYRIFSCCEPCYRSTATLRSIDRGAPRCRSQDLAACICGLTSDPE